MNRSTLLQVSAISTIGVASCVAASFAVFARQQEKNTGTVTTVETGRVQLRTFANASGWEWLDRPKELHIGQRFGHVDENLMVIGDTVVEAESGALRMYFIEVGPDVNNRLPPRVVILDAAGERYLPEMEHAGGFGNRTTQLFNAVYTLNPKMLSPSKAAYVGVEQINVKK